MDIISNGITLKASSKKIPSLQFRHIFTDFESPLYHYELQWLFAFPVNKKQTRDYVEAKPKIGGWSVFFLSDKKWGHGGEDKTAINRTR